jgi:hypothetical protein
VKKWKFVFQKIQSKVLLHEKALASTSILSLCALFASYFFGEVAPHNICIDVYYTSAHGLCIKEIRGYVWYLEIIFGTLALLIPLIFIFTETVIRKRFFRFLRWYIPLATIFAIIGYYAKFCLMWSCSSMLGAALAVDLLVFLVFFLSIGWSVFSKRALMMLVLLPPLILFATYGVTTLAEKVKKTSGEINQKARNDGGKSCGELKGVRERDQCLFLNGFQCDKIISSDIKQDCSDMLQRNKSVDAADIEGCDKIVGQQRSMCYSLVREELERRSHPDIATAIYTIEGEEFSPKDFNCIGCGWSIQNGAYADFDQDGHKDAAVILSNLKHGQYVVVLFNNGTIDSNGSTTNAIQITPSLSGSRVSINNQGKVDVQYQDKNANWTVVHRIFDVKNKKLFEVVN